MHISISAGIHTILGIRTKIYLLSLFVVLCSCLPYTPVLPANLFIYTNQTQSSPPLLHTIQTKLSASLAHPQNESIIPYLYVPHPPPPAFHYSTTDAVIKTRNTTNATKGYNDLDHSGITTNGSRRQ